MEKVNSDIAMNESQRMNASDLKNQETQMKAELEKIKKEAIEISKEIETSQKEEKDLKSKIEKIEK